jgi:hypothetical protein
MNISIAVLSLCACHSANHVSRWFMEFALMNICQIVVLSALATAPVMSADGSWSVCTHEHLTDRCSLDLRFATA